jgi:hypothetical protein
MGTKSIIQKLNDHLAQGLRAESDVTYLLVQLGKLVERAGTERNYPTLTFYRNWAVHEKLERVRANPEMAVILRRFDTLVDNHVQNVRAQSQGGPPAANVATLAQQIKDSISLGKLEAEIDLGLGSDQHLSRTNFRRLLLGILADISLQATTGFNHLRELKVKDDGQFNTIVLTDRHGQTFDLPLT